MASGVDTLLGVRTSNVNPFARAQAGSAPQAGNAGQAISYQQQATQPPKASQQFDSFDAVVFGNGQPKTATDWLQNSLSSGKPGQMFNHSA